MIKHLFLVIATFFCMPSVLIAAGKCEFFAKADVGVLEFTGTGCTIEGRPVLAAGKVSGEFTVDLTKLTAGDIDMRTAHMKEKYLEVSKYPKAILKLDPMPESGGAFSGKLTLHGIEKPITGKASRTGAGWSFQFDVKTSDHGIKKAGYRGIEIAESISVTGSIDK